MTKLTMFTPQTRLQRLLAPIVANAVSYLPPRALRPFVAPLREVSNNSRRRRAGRLATRTIYLIAGDGMAIRINRQHGGRP